MNDTRFAEIDWRGRDVRVEYEWIESTDSNASTVVFLHEGLGSVSMWKDFPQRLCAAGNFRGLVFSRPAYGKSSPRPDDEIWDLDFLHRQAHEVLPAFFEAIGLDENPWLFGHSDGGSISLLYAAKFPDQVAGIVLLAPHTFVEKVTVENIEKARIAYLTTDLPAKLGRYHDSADSAFWGWNRIWLTPEFLQWNIEQEIGTIRCPVLAIQGEQDEYGTLAQIRSIASHVPQTALLEVPECGHSPHRDQPEQVIANTVSFISGSFIKK